LPPDSSDAKATITIRRNSPEDAQQRQIVVSLDGNRAGELFYGDTLTLPVTAGHHRLHVDNTWNWKTLDLDITPGEHKKFLTVNRPGRFTWFLVGTLGVGPIYVSIQPES
jgi:hypothetical protein